MKSKSKKNFLVIGIATASNDIEAWHFDNDELCRMFCEQQVRNTGRSVIVVDGNEIGRYSVEVPIVYHKKRLT